MRRLVKKIAKVALIGIGIFLLFSVLQAAALRYMDPPFSAYMFQEWIRSGQGFKLKTDYKNLNEISPYMARAVIASEDQRFYNHNGFDWIELQDAIDDNRKGKQLRGASTITMQTARNMFLWQDRSWVRKALEGYYTVLLELFLDKNRILEIYLNTAEFGPGVFGVQAAANKYFGINASRLTLNQAARLTVVLPSPRKRSPLKMTGYLNKRKNIIIKQVNYIKLEGQSEKKEK